MSALRSFSSSVVSPRRCDMAAVRPARRLFLHLSALSDAEYSFYVDALRDLLDDEAGSQEGPKLSDDALERKNVGLREVRAWMKGRFRDVGAVEIDKVGILIATFGATAIGNLRAKPQHWPARTYSN